MPIVVFHKGDETFTDEVKDNTNLVVRAGIKQFPYPNLRYQCGMASAPPARAASSLAANTCPSRTGKRKSSWETGWPRATAWLASCGLPTI